MSGGAAISTHGLGHLFIGSVSACEAADHRLLRIRAQIGRGTGLEGPPGVSGIDDQVAATGVPAEVIVLLPIGGDRALEVAILVDEEPDRRGLGPTLGIDGRQRRPQGRAGQIVVALGYLTEDPRLRLFLLRRAPVRARQVAPTLPTPWEPPVSRARLRPARRSPCPRAGG